MSDRVFKQPNGNYAIFSSVVDGFTLYDATADDIIEHYVKLATEEARGMARRALDRANGHTFMIGPRTWAEAVALNDEFHPDEPVSMYLGTEKEG